MHNGKTNSGSFGSDEWGRGYIVKCMKAFEFLFVYCFLTLV